MRENGKVLISVLEVYFSDNDNEVHRTVEDDNASRYHLRI